MITLAHAVFFVLYTANGVIFPVISVKRDDPCKDRNLIFNTTSNKGDVRHQFRLPYTGVLFLAINDTGTVIWMPRVETVSAPLELNFFRAQWQELRRLSAMSPICKTRLELLYYFDTSTGKYNFSLSTAGSVASVSVNGHATIKLGYQTDPFVKMYANGYWTDRLKKDASKLGTKWRAYCERLQMNKSRTTISPHTTPGIQFTTPLLTTPVVISTHPSNEMDVNLGESTDALTAAATGSIVAVVILVVLIVPVAFMVWRWRGPLKNRFERVSTW